MDVIVNKSYKRKGTEEVLKLINIENGFAVFENNARCKIETLISEFEDGSTVSSPILENNNFISNNGPIDPEAFFAEPTAIDPGLMGQLEMAIKNPQAKLQRTIQDKPSVDLTDQKVIGGRNEHTDRQPPASMMPKSQTGLSDRLSTSPENIQINTENNYLDEQIISPEEAMFNKVKKTELVEFIIPLKIKLPKAKHIETFNDMFEVSFISHLAKQAIQDLLVNPSKLRQELVVQMEKWLNEQEEKPKKGKNKKVIKPIPPETQIIKEGNNPIINVIGSIENNFGLHPDLPYDITNDEDLKKIQEYIKQLYEEKTKDFKQIDHYENLIMIYKNKPVKV